MISNLLLYFGAVLLLGGSISRMLQAAAQQKTAKRKTKSNKRKKQRVKATLAPPARTTPPPVQTPLAQLGRSFVQQYPRLRVLGVGFVLMTGGLIWDVASILTALGALNLSDTLAYLTVIPAGRSAVWTLLGLCLLLVAELNRLPRVLRLACLGLSLWGLAGLGHGSTHGLWVRLLHTLHVGAMCVWLGGVAALLTLPKPQQRDAAHFTPYALGSLLTLVGTGMLLALIHLNSVAALTQTEYGRTLLLKLALLAALMPVVLQVRRAFSRSGHVRRWLLAELLLLTAIVAVTASLSQLPPPSHNHHHAGRPVVISMA